MDELPAYVEPSANIRQAAGQLRQMYVALRLQGFDDDQALMIVAHMAQAMVGEAE
jgi:hypothetical protein